MAGIHRSGSVLFTCALIFSVAITAGCKGGGSGGGSEVNTSTAALADTTKASNSAPVISGSAATTARPNKAYSFAPTVSDVDGDAISFQIQNKPAWATFSTVTGELSGTARVGTFADIVISASDGKSFAALSPFSIAVTQAVAPKRDITLAWAAPTQNSDGSPLTNLAGYIISFGKSKDALSQSVQINNPSVDRHVFDTLASGTYFFALRSVTANGELSDLSRLVKKVVP
jgi:hypothetical protein